MEMKLKELLQTHDAYTRGPSLRDNLGDGYLLERNPVYRAVRSAAAHAGFKFSKARFFDYDSLPLTQLSKIMSHKTIPYRNTVRPLREVEEQAPGVFSLNDIPPLSANYLFHESAHAAIYPIISKIPVRSKSQIERERATALHILLAESFANASESLSNIYATDETHDEFLYKNSYIMETVAVRKTLRATADQFGQESLFKILVLSFLHANFLKTKDVAPTFERVISLVFGRPPKHITHLKKVFMGGLDLDPEFTKFTNAFCLRLMGIKSPIQNLFDFDLMKKITADNHYLALLDSMAKIII